MILNISHVTHVCICCKAEFIASLDKDKLVTLYDLDLCFDCNIKTLRFLLSKGHYIMKDIFG